MVRDKRPLWRIANILCVDKLRSGRGYSVHQKGRLPNPDEHVFPLILEMAMNIDVRIIHQFGMNRCQYLHVNGRPGPNRGLLNGSDILQRITLTVILG